MFEKFHIYLSSFSQRKEKMIIIFGIVLFFLLLYILFSTGFETIDSLRSDLLDERALLAWMEVNAPIIEKVHQTIGKAGISTDQNTLGAIESSLQEKKLATYVEKSEQLQDQKIRISFKQISFDTMMQWLASLSQAMSFQVSSLMVQGSQQQGIVDAEVVLSLPSKK